MHTRIYEIFLGVCQAPFADFVSLLLLLWLQAPAVWKFESIFSPAKPEHHREKKTPPKNVL